MKTSPLAGKAFAAAAAFPKHRDAELLRTLKALAKEVRVAGLDVHAGLVMDRAAKAAWGDINALRDCTEAACSDFRRAVETLDPRDPAAFAALKALTTQIAMDFGGVYPDRPAAIRAVYEELAQRLLSIGRDSPQAASYLVRGVTVTLTPAGNWAFGFPEYEVDDSLTSLGSERFEFTIPSAFQLFVRNNEWQAAEEVAALQEHACTSPGLKGWRVAVQGLLNPAEAADRFHEAAEIFATDTEPADLDEVGGSWSSRNVDLWSKFFRARSFVARIGEQPSRAPELLQHAARALEGTESGWVNPQVSCLRILTRALTELIAGDPHAAALAARGEIEREIKIHGQHDFDAPAMQFLDAAVDAFSQLRVDPGRAVVSDAFPRALQLLGRIPLFGPQVRQALEPHVVKKAREEMFGPVRTWIHRTLESIRDEDQLRRVLLRLHQAEIPLYAQIRHGTLEYGKDIVVLVQEDGGVVLRMFQAKVGNINTPTWRDAQHELEAIFQVDLDPFQLPRTPTRREGVLVFNGHVQPHVEPLIRGWVEEQRRDHGRVFRLQNLDDLVFWIVSDSLANEFRIALAELGITIADAVTALEGTPRAN